MRLSRDRIVQMLVSRGDLTTAADLLLELPPEVDIERHRPILDRFGVDPAEVERVEAAEPIEEDASRPTSSVPTSPRRTARRRP